MRTIWSTFAIIVGLLFAVVALAQDVGPKVDQLERDIRREFRTQDLQREQRVKEQQSPTQKRKNSDDQFRTMPAR